MFNHLLKALRREQSPGVEKLEIPLGEHISNTVKRAVCRASFNNRMCYFLWDGAIAICVLPGANCDEVMGRWRRALHDNCLDELPY